MERRRFGRFNFNGKTEKEPTKKTCGIVLREKKKYEWFVATF